MLIDEEQVIIISADPILSLIATINGNDSEVKHIDIGLYRVGHFGCSNFLPGYDEYDTQLPNVPSYGVCDYPEQVLDKFPELRTSKNEYVITFTMVSKALEPAEGGWRWHKWGSYIGDRAPQCEYLYDEPEIDIIYVYRIYRRLVDSY